MFQQERSNVVTASSQPETEEELQTLLQREEIVDLKQHIDIEATEAAEARLSELMKTLEEGSNEQISLSEFTDKATEENLNQLVIDGEITEGEKSKIFQDRRNHQVITSRGASGNVPQRDETVEADSRPSNAPTQQVNASMRDILSAIGVAVGAHNETHHNDRATQQEPPVEDYDTNPRSSTQEHHQETHKKKHADLEVLRAMRDEISQNLEKHREIEATHNQVEAIESGFLTAEHEQKPIPEVKPAEISDALSRSLERLETISAQLNADLWNNEPVPFES